MLTVMCSAGHLCIHTCTHGWQSAVPDKGGGEAILVGLARAGGGQGQTSLH